MDKELKRVELRNLEEVVEAIFSLGNNYPIWTFTGNLGSGKTTLIKALAKRVGIEAEISSPTFNYVNDYDGRLYHFDCYRLEDTEEALDFGFEEYLDSGARCWIEWPEVILPLIESPYLAIEISSNEDQSRTYKIAIN